MSATRDELIAFLRTPDAYPHGPQAVDEVQTHISWVFLVDAHVYKVKKPVALGFLDFSTLEKRKHYCEQEVRLNRRLCPDVYLGVVPISAHDGRFLLDDDSNVVEYAVHMRRLEGGEFGHDLVDTGRLETEDLDRVIDTLAAFYEDESPTAEMASWGRTEKLAISTEENFEQTGAFAGALVPQAAFDAIRAYTRLFYDAQARLLNERRAGGRILDCHGDLHLEHVYLTSDGVCIYDCIEFNERFRTIDVANDVAFLAMDLDFHGRPDLSVYLGEQMADRLADPDLLRLLDFYKCYRAVVRAKVEGIRSRDDDVEADERAKSADRARAYLRLAARYATGGSKPLVLISMGGVGTGKSTTAEQLADALGWDVFSSDRIRKETAGVELSRRGDPEERAALYAEARTAATYESLGRRATDQVRRGRGVILDATYSKRGHRDELRTTLRKAGAPYCFVELTASEDTVISRLKNREAGQASISDARLDDYELLRRRYEAPDDLEDAFHFRVPTDEPGTDALEDALLHLVRFDF